MLRTVVATIYILVWGIATLVILIREGTVPPEYWTLPAIGLGALMGAIGSFEKKRDQKPGSTGDEEPPDDAIAKEGAK